MICPDCHKLIGYFTADSPPDVPQLVGSSTRRRRPGELDVLS
jgi:hypothetical protein